MTSVFEGIGRHKWRVIVAVALLAALVLVLATRGASAEEADYRTAEVTTGDVTQTLTATGSIESASRTDLAFQVGGTIDEVQVEVGDTVAAGDVLATLQTDDLDDAVVAAQETLTEAEDWLAENLEAQASGTTVTSEPASSGSTVSPVSYVVATLPLSSSAVTNTSATIASAVLATSTSTGAQDAVETAPATAAALQSAVDTGAESTAVADARAELVAAQTALLDAYAAAQVKLTGFEDAASLAESECAALIGASPADDATATEDGGEGGDDSSAADALVACQSATSAALLAQQASLDAQQAMMDAAVSLDAAVEALLSAIDDEELSNGGETDDGSDTGGEGSGGEGSEGAGSGGDSGAPDTGDQVSPPAGEDAGGSQSSTDGGGDSAGAPSASDATGSSQSGSQGSAAATSGGSVPSAADIVALQADVDAAAAGLAVAEQQVEYATLTAPVDGTVVSMGLDSGDVVSADDAAAGITLVADNSYLVQVSVGLEQARLLEVGQPADLSLLATGQVAEGVVSSVSTVNGGDAYSASYAVAIAIPDPGFDIRIGAATRMQITVANATGVLVVPTSAVTDSAGDATVMVPDEDGTAQATPIVTGAVGSEYTEVVSGLEAGQQVILADLSQAVTSDEADAEDSGGLLGGLGDSTESDVQGPGGEGFTPPGQGGGGGGRG
ncbi:efflux RND transporter periplasmic adaptor subunit [Demequina aurantiaca]|uniref:efflux RND transporter periplasmic adaptor subunit n=1 Tax=Demequina aurantiaca TaxID=676200 RepID=UPI003D337A35